MFGNEGEGRAVTPPTASATLALLARFRVRTGSLGACVRRRNQRPLRRNPSARLSGFLPGAKKA